MDKQALAMLIPIIALSIPVVAIVMNGLIKVARYRAMGSGAEGGGGGELQGRVDALEQEVDVLRHELTETHERLDFAERMLAQGEQRRELPQG
jgi:hypothetical protein